MELDWCLRRALDVHKRFEAEVANALSVARRKKLPSMQETRCEVVSDRMAPSNTAVAQVLERAARENESKSTCLTASSTDDLRRLFSEGS